MFPLKEVKYIIILNAPRKKAQYIQQFKRRAIAPQMLHHTHIERIIVM